MSKNIIDEATKWAQEFQERNLIEIKNYYKRIGQGETKESINIDIEIKELMAKMSLEDIKKHFMHIKGLNNNSEPTDEQFFEINKKIGLSPTATEALEKVITNRKKEYIEHYQIEEKDPGMMFIIMQVIQDELQVIRLRQDLIYLNFMNHLQVEKDDAQKRIIDSISKINKNVFDITKYLQQWRDEKVKLEDYKKDKEEKDKKIGINFQLFKQKINDHPGKVKAIEAQKLKKNKYAQMIEEIDD